MKQQNHTEKNIKRSKTKLSKTEVIFGHVLPRSKKKFYCKLCGESVPQKKGHLINFHKAVKSRLKNKSSNDFVNNLFLECV